MDATTTLTHGAKEQSKVQAEALADLLLRLPGAPIDAVADALGRKDMRTLASYLNPLVKARLVHIIEGDAVDAKRIGVHWPPVEVELLRLRANAWIPVGSEVPTMRSGEQLHIRVTTQLELMARVFVVTHRPGHVRERAITTELSCSYPKNEQRELLGRQAMPSHSTYSVELELDSTPGFEQILVHLSWLGDRGLHVVEGDRGAPMPPAQSILEDERNMVLERWGPGWIREFLVHHADS